MLPISRRKLKKFLTCIYIGAKSGPLARRHPFAQNIVDHGIDETLSNTLHDPAEHDTVRAIFDGRYWQEVGE